MLDVERILKEKGLNKSKLAELLGTDNRSYVSNLLNNNPTLSSLQKIADVLEVDVKDLFVSEKESVSTPIYIKDKEGNEKIIGYIDTDKIGFIFKK